MAKTTKASDNWPVTQEVGPASQAPDFIGETPPLGATGPIGHRGVEGPPGDLRAEVARLSGELARVMKLLGESTEGHETPEVKAFKAWAQLSAKDKTELVLAKEFPDNEPGTRPFDVRL